MRSEVILKYTHKGQTNLYCRSCIEMTTTKAKSAIKGNLFSIS